MGGLITMFGILATHFTVHVELFCAGWNPQNVPSSLLASRPDSAGLLDVGIRLVYSQLRGKSRE